VYLVATSVLLSSNIAIGAILDVFVIFGPVFKLHIADICAPDAWMAGSSTAHTNYLTTLTRSSTREHAFFLYKLVAANLRAPFHVRVSLYIDVLIKLKVLPVKLLGTNFLHFLPGKLLSTPSFHTQQSPNFSISNLLFRIFESATLTEFVMPTFQPSELSDWLLNIAHFTSF
jgi:hypothetical protein